MNIEYTRPLPAARLYCVCMENVGGEFLMKTEMIAGQMTSNDQQIFVFKIVLYVCKWPFSIQLYRYTFGR